MTRFSLNANDLAVFFLVLVSMVALLTACGASNSSDDDDAAAADDDAVADDAVDDDANDDAADDADDTAVADDDTAGVYWEPSTVVPIEVHDTVRGFIPLRGTIHLHNIFSHDACDGKPTINGQINEECLTDLRRDLCKSNQQWVAATEHTSNLADYDFPQILYYREEEGDELIYNDQSEPVANILHCEDGNQVILSQGVCSGSVVSVLMLDRMPPGTSDERKTYFQGRAPEDIDRFHALGALACSGYTEEWSDPEIVAAGIDGVEMFNYLSSILPGQRELYGAPSLGFLPDMLNYLFPLAQHGHPDLFLLGFLTESTAAVDHFNLLLSHQRAFNYLGNDVHRNIIPFKLWDGDRGDSYRRMTKWISNYVLADSQDYFDIKNSIAAGRLYSAFTLFGEPVGLDYNAEAAGRVYEMGEEVQLSDAPILHFTLPHLYNLDPSHPRPVMTVSLTLVTADGPQNVLETTDEGFDLTPSAKGAYWVRVGIVPDHLRRWLGDDPDNFMKEYPFIYTNAIYVK